MGETGDSSSGIHHLALVCGTWPGRWTSTPTCSGMPLVKTIVLPGMGQHFFFDCGGGDCLAFFWFPEPPTAFPASRPGGPARPG